MKIIKAEDLSIKSSGYVSFNFVQVELDPFSICRRADEGSHETKRVRNSISPIFNDLISINILPDELKEQTLILYVFDANKISPRDLIGAASLDMRSLFDRINGKSEQFVENLQWRREVRVLMLIHVL